MYEELPVEAHGGTGRRVPGDQAEELKEGFWEDCYSDCRQYLIVFLQRKKSLFGGKYLRWRSEPTKILIFTIFITLCLINKLL